MNSALTYTSPKLVSEKRGRLYVFFRNLVTKEAFKFYSGKDFGMPTCRGLDSKEKEVYYRLLLSMVNHQLSIGWTPESIDKPKVALDFSFKEAAA